MGPMVIEECNLEDMEPLTLEDKDERACFARVAGTNLQEAKFWVSTTRGFWCLQNGEKKIDVKAPNLQITGSVDKCFLYVSQLHGENVVLKEGTCALDERRTFACKVQILLVRCRSNINRINTCEGKVEKNHKLVLILIKSGIFR